MTKTIIRDYRRRRDIGARASYDDDDVVHCEHLKDGYSVKEIGCNIL